MKIHDPGDVLNHRLGHELIIISIDNRKQSDGILHKTYPHVNKQYSSPLDNPIFNAII